MSRDNYAKNQSMNSTHYLSHNQSNLTNQQGQERPNTSFTYAHIPMSKDAPDWNQSSATWRHTSPKHSFSRDRRFRDHPFYYSDIIEPQIPSSINSKTCTFGKGHRRPISQVVLRNAKEKPSPDRYNMSITDQSTRQISKGKTFGLGWKSYERTFINQRTDVYAQFQTQDNPGAKYEVREVPGENKLKFTNYGRLKMYSSHAADSKNWVPGPYHVVKDRHLYGTTGLQYRNFGHGERIDLTAPANQNPQAIYNLPNFCDKFHNTRRKMMKNGK